MEWAECHNLSDLKRWTYVSKFICFKPSKFVRDIIITTTVTDSSLYKIYNKKF